MSRLSCFDVHLGLNYVDHVRSILYHFVVFFPLLSRLLGCYNTALSFLIIQKLYPLEQSNLDSSCNSYSFLKRQPRFVTLLKITHFFFFLKWREERRACLLSCDSSFFIRWCWRELTIQVTVGWSENDKREWLKGLCWWLVSFILTDWWEISCRIWNLSWMWLVVGKGMCFLDSSEQVNCVFPCLWTFPVFLWQSGTFWTTCLWIRPSGVKLPLKAD